jgi:hypothetical protein
MCGKIVAYQLASGFLFILPYPYLYMILFIVASTLAMERAFYGNTGM